MSGMDEATSKVLDEYHNLIQSEREGRERNSRQPKDKSGLHLAVGPETE